MAHKIRFRLLLLAALSGLLLLTACGRPQSSAGIGQVHLSLEECQLSSPGLPVRMPAKCGKLAVYEDRAAAEGRKIELNVALIPAVSRNPAPDPIFFIPGGPGEAATESYLILSSAFEQLNQKRDIVLVDQRGTGGSNSLRCSQPEKASAPEEAGDEDTQENLKTCLDKLQADPRLYTTAIAMDDLDEVRQALGYPQVNLYGASYGTRAALAYARQHPEHVRTIILDGVAPPNWTLGASVTTDAQRALGLIFARCAADPACKEAFPDLPAEFQSLLDGLRRQPVEVKFIDPINNNPDQLKVDIDFFASTIHTLSYAPETVALLPLMIHNAAERNDFSLFAAQATSTFRSLNESITDGMRFSVVCAEDLPFIPSQPLSTGYMGDFFVRSFAEVCKIWPAGKIPVDFKDPVTSDAPVLLLSGEADPVTPPANGELAAQTLPNSLHIVVPGQGHINIHRGCIPQIATDFVEAGAVEGLDASCAQAIQPMPFFVNFSGPKP